MAKNQIILLYASLDDKPEANLEHGWISIFAQNLERLLKRLSEQNFDFLKLSEYDLDPDSFPLKTAVILPIFSKNLIQAPIFMTYLSVLEKEVVKKEKSASTVKFINVFKNRIPLGEIPDYLLSDKRYNFYNVDSATDFVTEISFQADPSEDHDYWMKIFDIAVEIRNFYDNKGEAVKQAEKLVKNLKPSGIYMAQTGMDQQARRDNLYRELIRSQYDIHQLDIPEGNYEEIERQINEKLSKCQLSVHLVGEDSGPMTKDKGNSIVEIENELAARHARQLNDKPGVKYYDRFNRIIWLSENQENLGVKQKVFIDNLKKDLSNIKYAEILECPIETLKGFIVNKIREAKNRLETTLIATGDKHKSIYLICDVSERDQCDHISQFLEEQGYEVIFSNFDGELLEIRDNHLRNLQVCDGTLIYYGNNNENWVKSKLFDSVKSLGLGRNKDKNPTAIIVDSNKKVNLDVNFEKENLILLKRQKINKNAFKSFLNQLE